MIPTGSIALFIANHGLVLIRTITVRTIGSVALVKVTTLDPIQVMIIDPTQAGGYRNSPRSDNSHRERNFRSGGDRPNRSYTPKFSERRTRRVLSEERYSDDHTPGEEVLDYSVQDNMSDDDSLTSLESLNP